jgi:hypothetical protein
VTLEALLTFIGILVAILAIVRPVQRRSLTLFVPLWYLGAAVLLSFVLIVCRDAPFGVRPPFGWSLSKVVFGLTLGAFVIPVGAALWSWAQWHSARLTGKNIEKVEDVFQAALREHEFDEVERILRKNQSSLEQLPAGAASVLFHPAMVAALVNSHSLSHLQLLANVRFLTSLQNRHAAVDVVVRELLRSVYSPLRSAVASRYGGMEYLTYSDSERELMDRTFQNPKWYFQANAHYPLTMSALEAVRTGKLDNVYNQTGRHYEATQGISTRVYCPIYLATKTEVLAIEAALTEGAEEDFYVTDLWDVFRAVQERSTFNETVWESSLSNHEHPTPYAYLLYEIARDLRDLAAKALQEATSDPTPPRVDRPGDVARALALTWSMCVWSIADSKDQVSPVFANGVIEEYLLFVLALGWQPSEIYLMPIGEHVDGLDVWHELFLSELKERFAPSDARRRTALKNAFESLDFGKRFVSEGHQWLGKQLFGTFGTS